MDKDKELARLRALEKVDTIEKWVVGPGDVVLSECENKSHAKEVAGIINSMIQAAYDNGYAAAINLGSSVRAILAEEEQK